MGAAGRPAPPRLESPTVRPVESTQSMQAHVASPDPEVQSETVKARCENCGDLHPVGDRRMGEVTTVCPHCGDTRYVSQCDAEPIEKSHADRIRDAVRDVAGVGEQTRENIVATYDLYYEFEAADEDDLKSIDGVGARTARRIVDAR